MITAHSGADGTKENSLEFVAYAMQTGADALEVDVRRCGSVLEHRGISSGYL